MHILKGYHRDEHGLIEPAQLMLEAVDRGFRSPESGRRYKAVECQVTSSITDIEIIDEETNTDAVYTAFLPLAGECERIGMSVARL